MKSPNSPEHKDKRRNSTPGTIPITTTIGSPRITVSNASQISKEKPQFRPDVLPRFLLMELLLSPGRELLGAILEVLLSREGNELMEAVVNFYTFHNQLLPFTIWILADEVNRTKSGATLFRGVSPATRIVSSLLRKEGSNYLKTVAEPIIQEICSSSNWEIDPEKVQGTDVKETRERLFQVSQKLLSAVIASKEDCPTIIRQLCKCAADEVAKKFPELKCSIIGGFFFLRFLCPALVTPETYGLMNQPPSKEARRGLILVSKILQNVSNGIELEGAKEDYMTAAQEFVSNNIESLQKFFLSLIEVVITIPSDDDLRKPRRSTSGEKVRKAFFYDEESGVEELEDELACILKHIISNKEKILDFFQRSTSNVSKIDISQRVEEICSLYEKIKELEEDKLRRLKAKSPRKSSKESPQEKATQNTPPTSPISDNEFRDKLNHYDEMTEKLKSAEKYIEKLKDIITDDKAKRHSRHLSELDENHKDELHELKTEMYNNLVQFQEHIRQTKAQSEEIPRRSVTEEDKKENSKNSEDSHSKSKENKHKEKLTHDLNQLKKDYEEQEEEIEAMKKELKVAHETIHGFKKERQDMKHEITKLQKQLAQEREQRQKAEQELHKFKKKNRWTDSTKDTEKKAISLLKNLMETQKEIQDLADHLELAFELDKHSTASDSSASSNHSITINVPFFRRERGATTSYVPDHHHHSPRLGHSHSLDVNNNNNNHFLSPNSTDLLAATPRTEKDVDSYSMSSVQTDETPIDFAIDPNDDSTSVSDEDEMDWTEFLRTESPTQQAAKQKDDEKRSEKKNFLKSLTRPRKDKKPVNKRNSLW